MSCTGEIPHHQLLHLEGFVLLGRRFEKFHHRRHRMKLGDAELWLDSPVVGVLRPPVD